MGFWCRYSFHLLAATSIPDEAVYQRCKRRAKVTEVEIPLILYWQSTNKRKTETHAPRARWYQALRVVFLEGMLTPLPRRSAIHSI